MPMPNLNFLKEKIKADLFRDSKIDSSKIRVEIEYNKILLNGSLITESSNLITHEIAGDFKITTNSNVACFDKYKNEYILERIKNILEKKSVLERFNIRIMTKKVIFCLTGNINNETFYKEMITSIQFYQGVLSIKNEVLVDQNLKGRKK